MVNFSDFSGGAAKSTVRLCKGLINKGILVQLLVGEKRTSKKYVNLSSSSTVKYRILVNRVLEKILKKILLISSTWSFGLFGSGLASEINKSDCDIVHLNWTCRGLLSLKDISSIKKPIVWTMHDSWIFTGGCHLPYACQNYKTDCGECPLIGVNAGIQKTTLFEKHALWNNNITYVAPSNWLLKCAKSSFLLRNKSIKLIPNGLDTGLFCNLNKSSLREKLGIPKEKKVILFGAVGASTDKNKGFDLLKDALAYLDKKEDYILLIFGSDSNEFKLDFSCRSIGYVSEEDRLIEYYSVADVFAMPSISENLPYTVMEALSCGLPVVAFNTGGVPDLVIHKKNGYLAKNFVSKDLAKGIKWVIDNNSKKVLSENAQKLTRKKFNIQNISKEYIKLYQEILGGKK